jgi:hypothetical protein
MTSPASLTRLEDIIDASGAAPRIEALPPIGVRHRQLRVRTLLLGMVLTLADRRPAYLTEVRAALIALPGPDQARLGVTEYWRNGPHQLTYRQAGRTFNLMVHALAKEHPDGAPSGVPARTGDDLLEASIPSQYKDASAALAVDWTDVETWSRPPRHGTTECAGPEAHWGHRNSSLPGPKGEMFFGFYLSAGTMTREEHGPAVPELARRMTLSSCELDPARALLPVLTRMPAAGISLGGILGDSGYAHRDAGAWSIPLRQAGAQLIQDLHPSDLSRTNFCPFYYPSGNLAEQGWRGHRGLLMSGMPRSVGPVRRLRSTLRSRLASLRLAASRLTWSPWTSPSQPFIRASAMRSRRLWMISMRRGRCCGETRSIAHRRQACSCWQDAP